MTDAKTYPEGQKEGQLYQKLEPYAEQLEGEYGSHNGESFQDTFKKILNDAKAEFPKPPQTQTR